jgi:hypothetical protein
MPNIAFLHWFDLELYNHEKFHDIGTTLTSDNQRDGSRRTLKLTYGLGQKMPTLV